MPLNQAIRVLFLLLQLYLFTVTAIVKMSSNVLPPGALHHRKLTDEEKQFFNFTITFVAICYIAISIMKLCFQLAALGEIAPDNSELRSAETAIVVAQAAAIICAVRFS